ncbi:thioredoxin family protein [Chitinophaga arvensicola]|uniref:Thioredoxin-related protein n=1 Tax=Chitinophaga arvensicola TaxID=29529 RepID=A0A1I0R047_9BACT|nr:thioredoxin fold domain-containing protein [Chitinophaga arvensicola]SEW33395.1 Thioredoxin-related protein [Chitinophaga arvensicola]
MKYAIKALLLAGLLPLTAAAQDSTQFIKGSWKELTAKARKEHKPIFVDTYFEGCHACKDMEVKVFPRPEVKKYMEDNFVSTGYDVFKEAFGKELCAKYFMTGFPTYLIISGEGKLINTGAGYQEPAQFMKFLENNISRYKAGQYLTGFGNSLKTDDPEFYHTFFFAKDRKFPDSTAVKEYLLKQKDLLKESVFKVMLVCRNLPANYRAFYIKNRTTYIERFGADLNSNVLNGLLKQDLTVLPKQLDNAAFDAFLAKQQQVYSAVDWQEIQMYYAENYLYKTAKDAKAFLEFAIAHHDTNENRVRYMRFYMSAELEKQPGLKDLYIRWAAPALTAESSLEVLTSLAYMCRDGHKDAAKKYFTWAMAKATAMGQPAEYFQKELDKLGS